MLHVLALLLLWLLSVDWVLVTCDAVRNTQVFLSLDAVI